MENIIADEVNHKAKYLSNDDPQYPCSIVADKYKGTCYLMQTSRMLTLAGGDFAKVFKECDDAPQVHIQYVKQQCQDGWVWPQRYRSSGSFTRGIEDLQGRRFKLAAGFSAESPESVNIGWVKVIFLRIGICENPRWTGIWSLKRPEEI